MRILLSNDDGVEAPGLSALWQAVKDLGEVTVVAPASPQSAAGHAITVHGAMEVRRLAAVGPAGMPAIAVDGRPADCVRLAVRSLLGAPPDLVLSGMNQGANVGINVFYSGTVAAAAEGAMLGIPAVAFSASQDEGPIDFPRSAALCRWALEKLLAMGLTRGDLFNVNIPSLRRPSTLPGSGPAERPAAARDKSRPMPAKSPEPAMPKAKYPSPSDAAPRPAGGYLHPRGVRFVPQSTAGVVDSYVSTPLAGGGESWQIGPDYSHRPQADSDVSALAEGYITITPLHIDMTNSDRLASLAGLSWQPPAL